MIVALLQINIQIPGITSLKQKRSVVKSLKERIANKFNASVCEAAQNDRKTSATIAIAIATNETRFANQQLDKILNFARNDPRFYIASVEREVFPAL